MPGPSAGPRARPRTTPLTPTREERAALAGKPAQVYLSANRTCEMGLRQATGHPYESFVFLLEELTR
jgi:D-lactate dehydrogenase